MEEEKNTQAPTIRDAVTYIVDENGNEIRADGLSQIADGGKEENKP